MCHPLRHSGRQTSYAPLRVKSSPPSQELKSGSSNVERRTYTLKDRATREAVTLIVGQLPLGSRVEIKGRSRTDEQNRAIHSLVEQILKQRPVHNGMRMSVPAYKAVFMHALGREITMIPTLDGDGFFPLGLDLHTSKLTVKEFNDLMEFVFAWCAREGLTIKHFDGKGGSGANNLRADAA